MRKLLRKQGYAPTVLVTDRLGSYGCARRQLGMRARHQQGLRKNNRAENSHGETTRTEDAGSSRPGQRSASSPLIPPSTTPSIFGPTSFPVATLRLFRAEAALAWHVATMAA